MTPVGHASLSFITSRALRGVSPWALMAGGLLPDVDVLFFHTPWFNEIHRAYTHSLVFLLVVAAAGGLFFGKDRKAVVLGLLAGTGLHLLVDSCMDINPTNGIGIALFWPFFNEPVSLLNVLRPVETAGGWEDPDFLAKHFLPQMLWEIPLYGLAVLLLLRRHGRRIMQRLLPIARTGRG